MKRILTGRAMRAGLAVLALSAIGLASSGTANAADHVVTPAGVAGTMIQNFNTHNCLDDSETYGVRAIPCVDGDTHQQWTYEDFGAGKYITKNGYTHRCLDDSVTYNLRAIACDEGNTHQEFIYSREITNADLYPGFQIESVQLGLCLDDSPTYHLRNAPCSADYNDHQRWFSLVY